jgi:PBP1b-binding outer membrane lipoprotein LpoB
MDGIRIFAVLGLAVALAGCSTPSQKYGLAPPSDNEPYPNINVDPTQKPAETAMTPEQLDAAKAELERRAGKKPSAPAFAAQ